PSPTARTLFTLPGTIRVRLPRYNESARARDSNGGRGASRLRGIPRWESEARTSWRISHRTIVTAALFTPRAWHECVDRACPVFPHAVRNPDADRGHPRVHEPHERAEFLRESAGDSRHGPDRLHRPRRRRRRGRCDPSASWREPRCFARGGWDWAPADGS